MTIDPTNVSGNNLIERIKNVLLTPQAEFDRIAAEPADVNKLYIGYALPLAVLAALCGFIGMSIFGIMGLRVGIVPGLVGAVLQVVMALAGVFVLAFVTNALAPSFGSQQDQGQAHKLAVYASTASFLASVFTIFPPLAMLAIVGLYSLALLFIGLPRLMKTPEDKRIGYFATIIVVCIVVGIVMSVVLGSVRAMIPGATPSYTFGQTTPAPQSTVEGQVTLPGGVTVDVGELERMAQTYEQGGSATPIDPARLQAQLPQLLPGGFRLASSSSASAMGTSQAEGVYQNGDARITVTVVHMGQMGAITAMAGAMNVQQNTQSADGYSRTQSIDGRMFMEEVSTSGASATYSVVGRGVALTADGSGGVTIDQVRAVVETISIQRLENEFGA